MRSNLSSRLAGLARGLAMLFLFTLVSGCDQSPKADYASLGLVEISGTVTLDGKPLEGGLVKFVAPDETYCTGVTDSSGRYTMMLDSRKSGVIPGEKVVEISSRTPPSEGGEAEEDPDAKPQEPEKVPACYNKESKLKISVTHSDSAMDFDLKSDCSTTTFK